MIPSHWPIFAPRTPRIKIWECYPPQSSINFPEYEANDLLLSDVKITNLLKSDKEDRLRKQAEILLTVPIRSWTPALAEAASTHWSSRVITETLTEIEVFFVDAESFQTFLHLIAPAVRCRSSINKVGNKTACTTGWVQINREWFHANQMVQRWCPLRCNRRLPFTTKINTNMKLWHPQEIKVAYLLKISLVLVVSVGS